MPLFTQRESRPAWFHETDQSQWLRPGLGDYLEAAAGDAWEGLPTVALGRLGEMAVLSAQATGTDVASPWLSCPRKNRQASSTPTV